MAAPGVAPASAILRAVAMDKGLTKTFSRSEDRALRSSRANAGVAPSPSARGGAPPTRSFGEYGGGGSSRRPGRVRYAFWRVSCGRPSRGVGVRKARRQSATTAMAHAPMPSIVLVVGIPHSVLAFYCAGVQACFLVRRRRLSGSACALACAGANNRL